MQSTVLCFLLLFAPLAVLMAHNGKKHKKDSAKVTVDSAINKSEELVHLTGDTTSQHEDGIVASKSRVTAEFKDFPSLHPLIVHFAIVLIIVAAGIQLLNLWLIRKEISWIVAGMLFVGVLAAWVAAKNVHPHTRDLSDHAKLVLDQHDKWANWTIKSGIVALLLQIANLFLFKSKRWALAIVASVLALSAYSVLRAGHYGSQLVHIEGIGPQGKYLEMEHQ